MTTASKFIKGSLQKIGFGIIASIIAFSSFAGISHAADAIHIIKKGETLSSIAKDYKITVTQLKDKNALTSNSLTVGKELFVPLLDKNGNLVTDGEPLAKGEIVYTVQKGDTLTKIAKKYGVTVNAIMKHNHMENTNLFVGRWLVIQTNVKKAPTTPASKVKTVSYKVMAGDTVYGLSKRFNMELKDFRTLNHLKKDNIFVGQKLVVPASVKKTVKGTSLGANDPHTFYVLYNGQELALQTSDAMKTARTFKKGTRITVTYELRNGNQLVLKSIQ